MYCKPWNAGLASETSAVARDLGRLFDALDSINSNLVQGDILEDIKRARIAIWDGLEAEGWTVSYQTRNLKGSNRCHVYAPDSKAGARIRADRERRNG
jgi:hypothetical protein